MLVSDCEMRYTPQFFHGLSRKHSMHGNWNHVIALSLLILRASVLTFQLRKTSFIAFFWFRYTQKCFLKYISYSLGLGVWIPVGGKIFLTCPHRSWDPPSPLYNGHWVSFPGLKRVGVTLTTYLQSNVEVKERVAPNLNTPLGLNGLLPPTPVELLSPYIGHFLAISNPCCWPETRDVVCVPVVVFGIEMNLWGLRAWICLGILWLCAKEKIKNIYILLAVLNCLRGGNHVWCGGRFYVRRRGRLRIGKS
jgi:hypothetical protein